MTKKTETSRNLWPLALLVGVVGLIGSSLVLYQPDRPLPAIEPGSSAGPAFVVQILRPRAGLPLGGILPPGIFGVDEALGFDSTGSGAAVVHVGSDRLELEAQDWKLVLVFDEQGRIAPETSVVFEMVFEERVRRVRCGPGDPPVGTVTVTPPGDPAELSGHFDVELGRCEDAATGDAIDWPPQPLVLHGSFDRLPLDEPAQSR